MIIQHNMMAMNTQRQGKMIGVDQSKSTEKLSSGYRINRAGDDAAGLAISEKMRNQVKGLNMASRNSQDAISLVQSAEGALTEVHSMLKRMRELAVQSANDTNVTDDRDELQKEINQLTSEINRVGNTTEFNTMKLLNGDRGITTIGGTETQGVDLRGVEFASKDTRLSGDLALKGDIVYTGADKLSSGTDVAITISADGTAKISGTLVSVSGNTTNLTGVSSGFVGTKNADGDMTYKGYGFEFTVKAGQSGSIAINNLTPGKEIANGDKISAGGAITTAGTASVNDLKIEGANNITNIKISGTGVGGNLSGQQILISYTLADGTNVSDTLTIASGRTSVSYTGANGLKISFDYAGSGDFNLNLSGVDALTDAGGKLVTSQIGGTTVDNSLKFQVGANENQSMTLDIGDMRSKALGITGTGAGFTNEATVSNGTNNTNVENALDITSHTSAAKAITSIDAAIKSVSSQRSSLGAVQNRLEHTINNLDVSSENLQAAESRIRDVNMASEMMEYSKNNILQQAAQAMLAQANQSTQGVLGLLR